MINSKISCILYLKIIRIDDSNRSCITIDIFHSLHIINGYKITSLIMMWIFSRNCSFFSIGNIFNRYSWQFLPTMKHIPFLSKISNHNPRISKLTSKHDNSLQFLLSDSLINRNNPTKIIYITKYNNIIFGASLLIDFRINFIYVDFII